MGLFDFVTDAVDDMTDGIVDGLKNTVGDAVSSIVDEVKDFVSDGVSNIVDSNLDDINNLADDIHDNPDSLDIDELSDSDIFEDKSKASLLLPTAGGIVAGAIGSQKLKDKISQSTSTKRNRSNPTNKSVSCTRTKIKNSSEKQTTQRKTTSPKSMPVVQRLTLIHDVGSIPQGTNIMIVTPTESDHTSSGILRALRRAGFTDDQFNEIILDTSNWEYHVMEEEDPGELNLQLARFSQPIYSDKHLPTPHTEHKQNNIESSIINTTDNEPILSGGYWNFWKKTLGNFLWLFFIFLFPIWIFFIIIKFLFKFAIFSFVTLLNICTFGLLDLDTDWDDLFN